MESKKIYFNAETFSFKTEAQSNQKIVKLEGIAIPFGKLSRNGVRYRDNSIQEKFKTLEKVSFLFNHDTNQPIGHVEAVSLNEEGVVYKADIDPTEEKFINKVERGDIRHVSIGAMVSNPVFNEDGTVDVDIEEFVELSLVPVPGFKDASAVKSNQALLIAEAFGNTEFVEKLKSLKENEEKKEANENKDESELDMKQVIEDLQLRLKEQDGLNEELKNRMGMLEARMDAFESEEEAEAQTDNKETETEADTETETEEENTEIKAQDEVSETIEHLITTQTKKIDAREQRLSCLSY